MQVAQASPAASQLQACVPCTPGACVLSLLSSPSPRARATFTAKPKCRPLWKRLFKRLDLGTACPPATPQLPALRLLPNGWAESSCRQLAPSGRCLNYRGEALASIQQRLHQQEIASFIQQIFTVPGTLEGAGKRPGNRKSRSGPLWGSAGH